MFVKGHIRCVRCGKLVGFAKKIDDAYYCLNGCFYDCIKNKRRR